MKKLLILPLFLSLGINGFGQEEEIKSTSPKKIRIGINYTPEFSHRKLIKSESSQTIDAISKYRNSTEIPKIGYSVGLDVEYSLSKKFSLASGLLYSNKGYKTKQLGLTFGDLIDPRRGFTAIDPNDPSIPIESNFVYSYYYLDIPLKVSYKIGKGKLKLRTTLGINTNIHLYNKQTVKLVMQDGSKQKSTDKTLWPNKSIGISPTIGIGIEKQIKEKHFLIIEPTAQFGIINNSDTPITEKLWSAGIKIAYHFGVK